MIKTIKIIMVSILSIFIQTYLFILLAPFFFGKYISISLTSDLPPEDPIDPENISDSSVWNEKSIKRDSKFLSHNENLLSIS